MRTRIHPQAQEKHFYFVTFVTWTEDAPQRIDNGVIGWPKAVDSLADIRGLEKVIKGNAHGETLKGGRILGDAGIRVRILDYKVIRRE